MPTDAALRFAALIVRHDALRILRRRILFRHNTRSYAVAAPTCAIRGAPAIFDARAMIARMRMPPRCAERHADAGEMRAMPQPAMMIEAARTPVLCLTRYSLRCRLPRLAMHSQPKRADDAIDAAI